MLKNETKIFDWSNSSFPVILFRLYLASTESRGSLGKRRENLLDFPGSKMAYYFFRPVADVDNKLTGIDFHVGQHR